MLPGDTEDTLAARLLVQEHIIYPRAIRMFIEDKLSMAHDQAHVDIEKHQQDPLKKDVV